MSKRFLISANINQHKLLVIPDKVKLINKLTATKISEPGTKLEGKAHFVMTRETNY